MEQAVRIEQLVTMIILNHPPKLPSPFILSEISAWWLVYAQQLYNYNHDLEIYDNPTNTFHHINFMPEGFEVVPLARHSFHAGPTTNTSMIRIGRGIKLLEYDSKPLAQSLAAKDAPTHHQ